MIIPRCSTPNIILFGETGHGKSSVVNLLAFREDKLAAVSDSANGVTFQNQCYVRQIDDNKVHIFDTVGLGEATYGTVSNESAIQQLYTLMRSLATGVDLLVFVIRGPRITGMMQQNYKVFYEIFCQKKVPIMLVVTHMEHMDDNEQNAWLGTNKPLICKKGMEFEDYICVTGLRSSHEPFRGRYDRSRILLQVALKERLKQSGGPWIPPYVNAGYWFSTTLNGLLSHCGTTLQRLGLTLGKQGRSCVYKALLVAGFGEEEALKRAKEIWSVVEGGKGSRDR